MAQERRMTRGEKAAAGMHPPKLSKYARKGMTDEEIRKHLQEKSGSSKADRLSRPGLVAAE